MLPDSVQVKLQYRAPASTGKEPTEWTDVPAKGTADLTKANGWAYKWENLTDGFEYRTVEVSMTWGSDVVLIDQTTNKGGNFTVSYEEDKTDRKTIVTNTLDGAGLKVEKVWDDEDNRDKLRAESVNVTLYRDLPLNATEDQKNAAKVETVTLRGDSWSYEWTNLPVYANGSTTVKSVYTVEEAEVTNYTCIVTYTSGAVCTLGEQTTTATVTNTYTPYAYSLSAIKNWSDESDRFFSRPETVRLGLFYKEGSELVAVTQQQMTNGRYSDSEGVYTTSAVIQEANSKADNYWYWMGGWQGLRKYRIVDGEQVEIVYVVAEVDAEGNPTANPVSGYTTTNSADIKVTAATAPAIVRNELVKTSLTITKEWEGETDKYDVQPEQLSFKVRKPGTSLWKTSSSRRPRTGRRPSTACPSRIRTARSTSTR